jgi:bis(5'-nucleosyl)-tetraphosphatase (symmetrical)
MAARRRIFIGDVHGCRVELERLLELVRFEPSADDLHVVGDFVNRGPDSLGVLRLCSELRVGGVLGNHDRHLLRVVEGTRGLSQRDTLLPVLAADDRDELCLWLAARPFVRDWPDLLLVHAGVHPGWSDPVAALTGLDPRAPDPRAEFATLVRYCDADGRMTEQDHPAPPAPYRAWYEFWEQRPDEPRSVVYGHWARAGLVRRPRVVGLDTGCVWGGRLTAWLPDEDRLVSVSAERRHAEF